MSQQLTFVSPTGSVSGAEVVLLNLVDEAGRRGAAVQCVCPAGDLAARLPDTVQWVEIPAQQLATGPRPVAAATFGLAAREAARTIDKSTQASSAVIVNGFLGLPAVRLGAPAAPVTATVIGAFMSDGW